MGSASHSPARFLQVRRRYLEIMRGEAVLPGVDLVPLIGGKGTPGSGMLQGAVRAN